MKKENERKGLGKLKPLVVVLVLICGVLFAVYGNYVIVEKEKIEPRTLEEFLETEPEGDEVLEWHVVAKIESWNIVGEAPYQSGVTHWASFFVLDWGQVPETVLANNATDWEASGDVIGYVDTDNTETDLESENPGYFVCRVKHNDTAKDGASWNWSRFRCKLTVTGDESIAGVYEYDNSSSDGDAVISATTTDEIWINYWWSDGVDGYRITDDGSLTWAVVIEERY